MMATMDWEFETASVSAMMVAMYTVSRISEDKRDPMIAGVNR
jgi:hypothetical protein